MCSETDGKRIPFLVPAHRLGDDKKRRDEKRPFRETAELFRGIADTASMMIWMSGVDKLCTYFNQPWLQFTGRSLDKELGNGWAEGVHTEDLGRCLDIYTKAFDLRSPFRMEYRLRRHDREYRWILDSGVPIFNTDGSFAGYIGSAFDVTENELIEKGLFKMTPRLIEALETECHIDKELHHCKESLVSLSIYMGYLQQHPPELMTEARQEFKEMRQEVCDIVNDLLGVSHDVTALVRARQELKNQVRDRTAEIQVASRELSQLTARLMRLRDEERRHFARELHDSVGQDLTALILELSGLERKVDKLSPELAEQVSKSCAAARNIFGSLRTMSYLLHPPLLDELGLASALRVYIEGFSNRSKIRVDLKIPADFGRLSNDMEITCFRIVQECLTNIHRHAKSPSALITISSERNSVLVEVEDRGKGIPRERLSELMSGGVGLAGIRERIKQLGGTLEIESGADGTTVTAILPLRHSTNAAG